jgi:hypothetical protein
MPSLGSRARRGKHLTEHGRECLTASGCASQPPARPIRRGSVIAIIGASGATPLRAHERRAVMRPEPAWLVQRWRPVEPQPADLVTVTRALVRRRPVKGSLRAPRFYSNRGGPNTSRRCRGNSPQPANRPGDPASCHQPLKSQREVTPTHLPHDPLRGLPASRRVPASRWGSRARRRDRWGRG